MIGALTRRRQDGSRSGRCLGALTALLAACLLSTGSPALAQPDTPLENGRLPDEVLAPAGGVLLAREAAEAFNAMVAAAAEDGVTIAVTDGYRTYDAQVDLKARKGWLAATPGRSMHGWGLAVDFDLRVTDFAWLQENAGDFGWVHPPWAQPDGSKPEPWHWEYVGPDGGAQDVQIAPATTVRASGSLVAVGRLEFADGPRGAWFAIREGVEDLARAPGRYPTTGEPGEPGNFAVAGYHRTQGAPLRGMDRLAPDDHVRVRLPGGDVHRYRVIEVAELGPEDVWAVEPDPRDDGAEHMLTLTTSPTPDTFLVVWAELEE
ncbi:D-alanyl-D-alanine carboxypeptidase family protein [Egicoccus sp. AB-alg2]|uniref:D-alanyl-D-alanine carboxypeptidase family protein n=1 Tax=Egicoccus sp. AB-alg2 TaxID=3242693 RepID=UPI00359E3969